MSGPDFSTRERPRTGRLDLALLAASVALVALAGPQALGARREVAGMRAEVESAREEAARASRRAQGLERAGGPVDAAADRAALTLASAPPLVLSALAELLPADVRLESVSIRYAERAEVSLAVTARSAHAYDVFLQRLVASPEFTAVRPGPENRQGLVRASVDCVHRGGGVR